MQAGRLDLVQTLLRERASPNETDDKGVALLHLATFAGQGNLCKVLLNARGEVNVTDQHGQTPLFFAPTRALCEALHQRKADTNLLNHKGQSALHLASRAGLGDVLMWLSTHVSKALLELRDMHGATAAYYARVAGLQPEIIQRLRAWPESGSPDRLRPTRSRSGTSLLPVVHEVPPEVGNTWSDGSQVNLGEPEEDLEIRGPAREQLGGSLLAPADWREGPPQDTEASPDPAQANSPSWKWEPSPQPQPQPRPHPHPYQGEEKQWRQGSSSRDDVSAASLPKCPPLHLSVREKPAPGEEPDALTAVSWD